MNVFYNPIVGLITLPVFFNEFYMTLKKGGDALLHIAVSSGSVDMVRLLLENGARESNNKVGIFLLS